MTSESEDNFLSKSLLSHDSSNDESTNPIMQDDYANEEVGDPSESSSPKRSNRLRKVWAHTPMEILSGLAAVVSVGTSVTGMIIVQGGFVIVAGLLTSLIVPYAHYQQTKLTDILALKETHEAVRREVNRLENENVRLNETVGNFFETMDGLEDVEKAVDITQTPGQSVDMFKIQVEENREILGLLQMALRANVLQNLLQVVVRSYKDDNKHIEEDEIGPLITRIKKINGVDVTEDRFKDMIMSTEGSLSSVMDIIKNYMADDVGGGDYVFAIRNEFG